jgi:hypothetical protein
MASHEPFGHPQPKLWVKERSGVKLAVWLSITKSRESTSSWRLQKECNMALKRSRGKLQLWFRPGSNRSWKLGDMSSQSLWTPTRDNFGTPPWESREKKPFGCSLGGELQSIIYGGRWWLASRAFQRHVAHYLQTSRSSRFSTFSLTLDLSFAHNLGCKCPNGSCEAILDIYTLRTFQWHQKHPNARFFDP